MRCASLHTLGLCFASEFDPCAICQENQDAQEIWLLSILLMISNVNTSVMEAKLALALCHLASKSCPEWIAWVQISLLVAAPAPIFILSVPNVIDASFRYSVSWKDEEPDPTCHVCHGQAMAASII